jgi:hypothetical protein
VVVGRVGALGAVVFRALISLVHNLLFLGRCTLDYNAKVHTLPGPRGPLIILVPVLGAAAVAFLVQRFAPEAKGHGVPEVIDALYYNQGNIRPVVAAMKAIASAISIGSGGSVGRPLWSSSSCWSRGNLSWAENLASPPRPPIHFVALLTILSEDVNIPSTLIHLC